MNDSPFGGDLRPTGAVTAASEGALRVQRSRVLS